MAINLAGIGSEDSIPGNSLAGLRAEIGELIANDDLAAVIIHLNDTYRIEERRGEGTDLECPGFARVVSLVDEIRTAVFNGTQEDRTIVLHSGDFLSPSYMSNTLKFNGEQIVELMNLANTKFVTLGNHEFDLDLEDDASVLEERLRQADFVTVATNLWPCEQLAKQEGFCRFERIVRWPQDDPFLAILGLSGADTGNDAEKHGFESTDWEAALKDAISEIAKDVRISCLLILSHMERLEDINLQELVNEEWRGFGYAYVLGGHDHDFHWSEVRGRCKLSKNNLNLRSVTVALLTKSHMAVPRADWQADIPSVVISANQDPLQLAADVAIQKYREKAAGRRTDLIDAYCRHLNGMIALRLSGPRPEQVDMGAQGLYLRQVNEPDPETILSEAIRNLDSSFTFAHRMHKSTLSGMKEPRLFWQLHIGELASLEPNLYAEKQIQKWLQKRNNEAGPGNEIIATSSVPLIGKDNALRSASTNLGNFIADALMAATGADLAIVHSGSFRSDETIVGDLCVSDLRETFVYDNKNAITVVKLFLEEVKAIYEHARGKAHQGGFLQVSRTEQWIKENAPEELRVAMPTYLLIDNKDGYQELLSKGRGCDLKKLMVVLAGDNPEQGSVIGLVRRGVNRQSITCSNEERLIASIEEDPKEEWVKLFVWVCRRYYRVCREAGLNIVDDRLILEQCDLLIPSADDLLSGIIVTEDHVVIKERNRVYHAAFWAWENLEGMRGLVKLIQRLRHGREGYEERIPFSDYLTSIADSIGMMVRARIAEEKMKEKKKDL